LGIETRQPKALRSGPFPRNFGSLEIDVGVVVAYGRVLTRQILDAPRLGMINGHGSLLPAWRGAAPIEWALMSGDPITGVTTMQMDEGLDTGPMLLRRELTIAPADDRVSLRARMSHLTAQLIVETLTQIESLTPTPQPAEGATHAPPITRAHGRIDWTRPATAIHDQVRALSPRPGASCAFREGVFKIAESRPVDDAGTPGVVALAGKRLLIGTGAGCLEVVRGQLPGKKALGARDLVNGAHIRVGEVFE
jgi:methionyl-tRNA formyltransferase